METVISKISGTENLSKLEKLLNIAFEVPQNKSFFDDFPVWNKNNGANIHTLGVFENNNLLSTAGLYICKLKTPKSHLNIGLIGGVATHPGARGRGFASKIVRELILIAKKNNLSLLLLWGSEHSLYRKLGFELCGIQERTSINALDLPSNNTGLEINSGWTRGLLKLLQNRSSGILIDEKNKTLFEKHKNVTWYWTGKKEAPLAYAAIGRGIDLSNIIHEWGGDINSLLQLLAHLKNTNPKLQIIGHPDILKQQQIKCQSKYKADTENNLAEYMCMSNILDPKNIISALYPDIKCEQEAISDKNTLLTNWNFKINEFSYKDLTPSEVAQMLLGPDVPETSALAGFLPVKIWIWGLDAC